jgi:predicted RNA polymerase sigma factor
MEEGTESGARLLEPISSVIRFHRPVRLAIGALVDAIKSWPRIDLPWIPDSWVLQSSLGGLVWRYERWADRNQETLAVALVSE